jgi:hypothetical protein
MVSNAKQVLVHRYKQLTNVTPSDMYVKTLFLELAKDK